MQFYKSVFFVFIFMFLLCDKFSNKNKKDTQNLVIDYSRVDISPTFNKCKKLSISAKKECFAEEVNKRVNTSLLAYDFTTEEEVKETVLIDLLIDKNGVFKLKEIKSSKKVKQQLPKLDSLLKSAINKLPKITPAYKRGIPVITQYQLPLQINTN